MFSPKAVLFDFGGTLDAEGRTWLDRARSLYALHGFDTRTPKFDRAFYDADDQLPAKHRLAGLDLGQVVELQVRDTIRNFGGDVVLAPRIADALTSDARAHLGRSLDLIERLKNAGLKIGLVTNFYGNMRSMLEAEGIAEPFDAVADSGETLCTKPDAGIFLAALKKLDVAPADALMVGDSLPRDMKGAEGLGMPHAWLAGERAGADEPCCPKVSVLRRLAELESLIQLPTATRS